MRIYAEKKLTKHLFAWVLPLLFFTAILCIFAISFGKTTAKTKEQQLIVLQNAFERAVINCYATEGSYPQNSKYIEENYGVYINHDLYVVDYEAIGSNIRPTIKIIPIGK
ncbi:MAG: hypothetical protein RSA79_04375 [Oscillospiraceae bacterium]